MSLSAPQAIVSQATDILWTYSSAELYDLLVIKSGWPASRYGQFIGDALIPALLDSGHRRTALTDAPKSG